MRVVYEYSCMYAAHSLTHLYRSTLRARYTPHTRFAPHTYAPPHTRYTLATLRTLQSKKGSDGTRDTALTQQREGIKLNDRLKRARPRAGRKQSHRQLRVGSQVLQAISEAAWVIEREDPGYVGKGSELGGVDGD